MESRPRVVITDGLTSLGAAKCDVLRSVEHCQSRYLNNRVENSDQLTRKRERYAAIQVSKPRSMLPVCFQADP